MTSKRQQEVTTADKYIKDLSKLVKTLENDREEFVDDDALSLLENITISHIKNHHLTFNESVFHFVQSVIEYEYKQLIGLSTKELIQHVTNVNVYNMYEYEAFKSIFLWDSFQEDNIYYTCRNRLNDLDTTTKAKLFDNYSLQEDYLMRYGIEQHMINLVQDLKLTDTQKLTLENLQCIYNVVCQKLGMEATRLKNEDELEL